MKNKENPPKTHIIIAPYGWKVKPISYRRDKLASYLAKKETTKRIIWIYPDYLWNFSYRNYKNQKRNNLKINSEDILTQIGVPVFKNFNPHFDLFQRKKLQKLKEYDFGDNNSLIIWFTYPIFSYFVNIFPNEKVIYDCSDYWGKPMGEKKKKIKTRIVESLNGIESSERKIINNSHIVFSSSKFLKRRIEERYNKKAFLVENGVESDLFQKNRGERPTGLKEIPNPRFGFIGGMKEKIDFFLLKQLFSKKTDWNLVLIGPAPKKTNKDFEILLKGKNVFWLGEVKHNQIPGFLSSIDVGLLPYKEIEYNQGVFPLKFFEYLAAGLPVVGSGLPSTKEYSQDNIYYYAENEIDSFYKGCKEALHWKQQKNSKERISLAKKFDWKEKFDLMMEHLGKN